MITRLFFTSPPFPNLITGTSSRVSPMQQRGFAHDYCLPSLIRGLARPTWFCIVSLLFLSESMVATGAPVTAINDSQNTEPALLATPVSSDTKLRQHYKTRPFQGIPGVARAANGRLWATWYAGGDDEGPENYVILITSNDNGQTWSDLRYVIDPPGEVRAYDPVVWIDPQGRLWWFYAQSYRWWDGRGGVWAVVTDNPASERPVWSAPRRIADGIMMNKPTVLRDGTWLLPISIWNLKPRTNLPPEDRRHVPPDQLRWNPEHAGAHLYTSSDNGTTFSLRGSVIIPRPQFDEHMFVERHDGTLWLLARNQNGMAESVSTDGGKSWSEAKPASIPHVASRFFIRRLASGKLLLVKHNPRMDTAWLAETPITASWQQRSHLTAYISSDDGKSWKGGLLLDERVAVSYPDGDQSPDGTIYVIYDFNRKIDREILLARFTEDDVLAGHMSSPIGRLKLIVNKAGAMP